MTDTRADYIEGLRVLADLLDAHPGLPLPYHASSAELIWIETYRVKESARLFARLIPGTVTKTPRGDSIDLTGRIAGLNVLFIASRADVCERVITGTHEVTVPARAAIAATPGRVETVEDVKWVCGSLLAEDSAE